MGLTHDMSNIILELRGDSLLLSTAYLCFMACILFRFSCVPSAAFPCIPLGDTIALEVDLWKTSYSSRGWIYSSVLMTVPVGLEEGFCSLILHEDMGRQIGYSILFKPGRYSPPLVAAQLAASRSVIHSISTIARSRDDQPRSQMKLIQCPAEESWSYKLTIVSRQPKGLALHQSGSI